jgi:hypothetical protein
MFWTHWNLSALPSFYGLAASDSETEYSKRKKRCRTSRLCPHIISFFTFFTGLAQIFPRSQPMRQSKTSKCFQFTFVQLWEVLNYSTEKLLPFYPPLYVAKSANCVVSKLILASNSVATNDSIANL